ncbi:DHH phosphoesterase [Neoconidiobolus thromboides FSU 785]|nr:DHH phosphoesterase [Neoconidiobolus thromboides FSU 785]
MPRLELGLQESESWVLAITLHDQFAYPNEEYQGIMYKQLKSIKNHFINYINNLKTNPKNILSKHKLRLIIGNEAADLDSIVSSIALGLALNTPKTLFNDPVIPSTLSIPIINIPRQDIQLRPEALFLFDYCNLTFDDILFINDEPVSQLIQLLKNSNVVKENIKLDFTLVDHNILNPHFSSWPATVSQIFDHHQDEKKHLDADIRIVEPVGSNTTLIMEQIKKLIKQGETEENLLSLPSFAKLLLGPILVDTVNLKGEYGRVTDKDRNVANELGDIIKNESSGEFTFDDYFKQLNQAKKEVGSMNTVQLLRRDFKTWEVKKGISLGISSIINFDLKDWRIRDKKESEQGEYSNLLSSCQEFSEGSDLTILIVLLSKEYSSPDKDDLFRREMVIYTKDRCLLKYIQNQLEKCAILNLKNLDYIKNTKFIETNFIGYEQKNISASRKVSYPIIRDMLINYK